MATVKIKENSIEASALLEYLRSLSFVEGQKSRYNITTEKAIKGARAGKGMTKVKSVDDLMEQLDS